MDLKYKSKKNVLVNLNWVSNNHFKKWKFLVSRAGPLDNYLGRSWA